MAFTTKAKLMELRDVKIAPLLTDVATAPTYGTAVDVEGVTKLTISPKAETKKLQGDSVLKDIYQRITEVEVEIEFGILDLAGLTVIQGGTVTTGGTTPNQKSTYSFKGTDASPGYFKIEGQWTYTGIAGGDAHFVAYKVKATDLPSLEINDASGNFGTVKVKGIAITCDSNSAWYDIVLNETATAIATS